MNILGMITEYHPFHNGHEYLVQEGKRLADAPYSVAVMSGNYVQRGTPAFLDKYTRAKMALAAGVDLVLELPVIHALSSARYFASGAVDLLSRLGVSHLAFGSESGDLSALTQASQILLEEPEAFKDCLKMQQRAGHSHAAARQTALETVCPGLGSLLSSPNNLLALEYLCALKRQHSAVIPLTLSRTDSGYHSLDRRGTAASASAIRTLIQESWDRLPPDGNADSLSSLSTQLEPLIPSVSQKVLMDHLGCRAPLWEDQFSLPLGQALLSLKEQDTYWDLPQPLFKRIVNQRNSYTSFTSFVDTLAARNFPRTTVSRSLMHLMLDIRDSFYQTYCPQSQNYYARILGFRRESQPLLTQLARHSQIPLLSKVADSRNILPPDSPGDQILQQNIKADHLYRMVEMVCSGQSLPNEYTHSIVIV